MLGRYYAILPSDGSVQRQYQAADLSVNFVEPGFAYNSGTNSDFLSVDQLRDLIENMWTPRSSQFRSASVPLMHHPDHFLSYGRQTITEDDIAAVVEVLRSPLLTQGPAVPAFEQAIAAKVGASYGVAANSATSSLASRLLGPRSSGRAIAFGLRP